MSAKGSEVPGRFGCCNGPEHARGAIASFARTLLGQTALRGAFQIDITNIFIYTKFIKQFII
jgi:hypothetical protein